MQFMFFESNWLNEKKNTFPSADCKTGKKYKWIKITPEYPIID